VLNNLAAIGVGLLAPVSVIGDDGHGFDLLKELKKLPVDTSHLLCAAERLTPTYTKPLRQRADGVWEELNRIDVRTRGPLSAALTAEVCRRVEQVFHTSDGLIVLDQLVDENCGVVNAAVRDTLDRLTQQDPRKLIYVDSRRFLGQFGCGVLKGNRSEVLGAADEQEATDDVVRRALARLSNKTRRPAYCTLGEQGILVARPDQPSAVVPGYAVSGPIDIVGAGDAATSGIVTALLSGADELEAAALGNLVASITIQQLGTTGTATPEQVRERWKGIAERTAE